MAARASTAKTETAPARPLARELGGALLLVLGLRAALGLFAALALLLYRSAAEPWGDWTELALRSGDPGFFTLGPWLRFDALWYLKIAQDGYATRESLAFFPLYPLLVRALGAVLGNPVAALAVSTASLAGALVVLRRLVEADLGAAVAERTALVLLAFPTAFFLFAPYTESLFLLLALLAIWGARSGRWGLTAAAGLLAGLTRAQGIFLVLPLAWEALRGLRPVDRSKLVRLLCPVAPAAGWLGFVLFATAKGVSPMQAQTAWGYGLALPWDLVAASVHRISLGVDIPEALNLAALVGVTLLCVAGVRGLPAAYSLYALPQLLLLLTRQMQYSPLMSASRLVLVVFPAFVVLARALAHPIARQAVLTALLLLQALFFFHLLQWGFVA